MEKIINYAGLFGDKVGVPFPDFIHHENLQSRSKLYDWEIQEHFHSELFQIFFFEKGSGTLTSQKRNIKFESPCYILIPGTTPHGFSLHEEVRGEVFTFSESFLEVIFKEAPHILMEIAKLKVVSLETESVVLDQLIYQNERIIAELNEDFPEKRNMITLILKQWFLLIYRKVIQNKEKHEQAMSRPLDYFKRFQKSIRSNQRQSKSISEYARELGISTVHLNRICRQIVNKPAHDVMMDYLIAEAKNYLLNTDYRVAEIAYLLDFKDPAYFTRIFKKLTGESPTDFKKI